MLEIALIPLCATMLVPMNFHELQLMVCYCAYVEIFVSTHSAVRRSGTESGPRSRPPFVRSLR